MPTYQSESEDLQTTLHVSRLAQGVYHLDLRVTVVLNRISVVLEQTALYNTTGSHHVLLIPSGQVINLPSHSQLVTSSRDEFLVSALLGERQRNNEDATAGANPPAVPQQEERYDSPGFAQGEPRYSPEPASEQEEGANTRQSPSKSSEKS